MVQILPSTQTEENLDHFNVDTIETWEVFDESGEAVGLFQADFYARKGKQGGAWMHSLVTQSRRAGTKPVIMNNSNFDEPAAGQDLLLTWDQVETVFHEFGHALHGLLSDTYYASTSGTAVPRDFVELPSQLFEMWAYHPEVLSQYAVHHETGEPLPEDLVAKLSASKTFGQGFATTEFIASALVDQAWRRISADEVPTSDEIEAFEQKALKDLGVHHDLVPPRYRTAYFKHTFGGGYDAGYYSYMWAEVLVADIEQWFGSDAAKNGDGGLNRVAGQKLRRELLSRGSSRDPAGRMISSLLGLLPVMGEPCLERDVTDENNFFIDECNHSTELIDSEPATVLPYGSHPVPHLESSYCANCIGQRMSSTAVKNVTGSV